jgi:hypothetical protein
MEGYSESMDEKCVTVHAHWMDADGLIESYRLKGYVLSERTPPTILAQAGFERLVFITKEEAELQKPVAPEPKQGPIAKAKKGILAFLVRPPVV